MRRVVAPLGVALAVVGCRSPTQIEVTVTTDLDCARASGGAAITTGALFAIEGAPVTTTSTRCTDGRFGAVVLVPSGDDGAQVAFKVTAGIDGQSAEACVPTYPAGCADPQACTPSYGPKCIVARRALRFEPHASLEVPVILRGACAGVACPATQTCVRGACVDATLDPARCEAPSGCDEGALGSGGPTDAGIDATIPDATTDAPIADGTGDAPIESGPPAEGGPTGAAAGCDLAGLRAGSPWPMEGYCPAHRFQSPLAGPAAQPGLKWKYVTNGLIFAAPAIGPDGTLYVSTLNGVVEAIGADGGGAWTYVADGGAQIESMPVLAADSTLRAFDRAGNYAILDVDGGAVRAVHPTPISTRGGLTIIGDGRIVLPDNTSKLYEIDPNGATRWIVDGIVDDLTYPAVATNGTVLTSRDGVFARRPDGGELWTNLLDGSSMAISSSFAPDGTVRTYSLTGSVLYALDGATGGVIWSKALGVSTINGIAVADDGTTYVGGDNGVSAYDKDGNLAGNFPGTCGKPVLDVNRVVYIRCGDRELYALDPSLPATPRWHFTIPAGPGGDVVDTPVVGPNGTIYLAVDVDQTLPDGGLLDAIYAFGP